ncbi:hypothetical protein PENTCL1PPCAC_9743, partial [Pristionchus entomophagus]
CSSGRKRCARCGGIRHAVHICVIIDYDCSVQNPSYIRVAKESGAFALQNSIQMRVRGASAASPRAGGIETVGTGRRRNAFQIATGVRIAGRCSNPAFRSSRCAHLRDSR